jgi:putative hydrolase of the HAD superfamily
MAREKPVSALVFDFGNVITLPPDRRAFDAMLGLLAPAKAGPAGREEMLAAYSGPRLEYDRGRLTAAEYWRLVGTRLGVGVSAPQVEALRALDVACWFHFDEAMLALLERLRPAVRHLALLSNINEDCVAALRSRAPWLPLFDRLILSCEHRVVKPEAEIYRLCVASLGVEAGDCLFVDDLEANIEGARACGLNGHQYRGLGAFEAELGSAYRLVA